MDITNIVNSFNSSPSDEMKEYILSFSREFNLDTGNVLPLRQLFSRIINLTPVQKGALVPAIGELAKDGVFEERNDEYFLTEAGRNILYP